MIKIGVIGAGPNAAGHARYFHESPRATVVAIADPDQVRANALAGELGSEAVSDYRDFLNDVDAIVISSPNFLHREHAITCAEAGVHLFCEKPMGLSLDDAQAITESVNQAGVKSVVAFSVRFSGVVQTMMRMCENGDLGDLLSVCSRRLHYFPPHSRASWREDHSKSGGLLYEINIHELDWMVAVGGPVQSVYARFWAAKPVHRSSNDHVWIMLNFANHAVGMHEGSWATATPQFSRHVQGTEAGLITNEWGNELYLQKMGGEREVLEPDPAFDKRSHFMDCIEYDAQPVSDVNWGLKIMAVAEAVVESAASGQPVDVKPVEG